ncbi:hypothetical protein ONZ43_g3683 [Nemania bipapillata]|uniref:Uncharacterized protein n=1 Tax=Nemania bipapillata TaxID=110536 RepID=A0ACC2IW27_9PEZI|nr:hypothetical protein ONZ43_g3683 [Nemania bipapillata]
MVVAFQPFNCLGGVGKTQIATAFAYESYASARYSTVLWIFAINRDELLKSFTRIAKFLGLYPETGALESADPMPPLALALLRWLSRDDAPRWLLIFDNVDDLDSFDVTDFFPKVPWGDILITSRRRQAERLGHSVTVDVMDSSDAVELLHRCSGIPAATSETAAKKLAEALGFLPLALDQAGAYISEQNLGFDGYMDLYGESRGHLLRHKPPKAVWCYEETVFTTWEISFAAVSEIDTLASQLLDVAAFFHSDDVPLALLCPLTQDLESSQRLFLRDFLDFVETRLDYSQIVGTMCNELKVSKIRVQQAIGRLTSFSLVRQKKESQSISVHPLVHFWLRERQSDTQRFENCRAAICLVLHALINAYDLSQFRDAEAIYPYLFICLEHVNAIPGLLASTELQKLGACIIAVDSWVPFSIDPGTLRRADGFYHFINSKGVGAAWVIPDAMLAMRRALRLKSIGHRQQTSEHCSMFLQTFEQRSRFDKMYAACMARTAGPCCYRVGNYDDAEKVYGYIDDSLDSTGTMLARKQLVLGAIKTDRGLPVEAEALLSTCASELVRGIGHEHFLLRVWHQLMATCLMAQGRFGEAEETVVQQLNTRLEQLNAGKIEFTFSDYELVEVYGRLLRKQQRYEEGRSLLAGVLARTRSKAAKPERALAELSMALTSDLSVRSTVACYLDSKVAYGFYKVVPS